MLFGPTLAAMCTCVLLLEKKPSKIASIVLRPCSYSQCVHFRGLALLLAGIVPAHNPEIHRTERRKFFVCQGCVFSNFVRKAGDLIHFVFVGEISLYVCIILHVGK